ncbi:MAG: lysylphosphatidylglycerol synthase domain-containing protein [Vicinamibacterales bacterium]
MTAGVALGATLFVYAVASVGLEALVGGVRRVGWGLLAILALGGARFAVRAQCWRWCLPPGVALDFPHAFSAFLAGDAVGNVTPLGLLASEPAKVLLVRHHLATLDSVSSLTLENILYGLSVLAVLAFGVSLLLATTAVPGAAWWVAVATVAATMGVAGAAIALLRAPRLRLWGELGSLTVERPGRLVRVLGLECLFHVLAVLEAFLTLRWLLGDQSPTAIQAVVFETVSRFTTVVFKFVPFRIGVDEATAGAVAPLLAVTAAAGVTLAVIRKARMLFWTAVGLLVVAGHPVRRSR